MVALNKETENIAKYFADKWGTTPETVTRLALIYLRERCLETEPELQAEVDEVISQFVKERTGAEAQFDPWPADAKGLNRKMKELAAWQILKAA